MASHHQVLVDKLQIISAIFVHHKLKVNNGHAIYF